MSAGQPKEGQSVVSLRAELEGYEATLSRFESDAEIKLQAFIAALDAASQNAVGSINANRAAAIHEIKGLLAQATAVVRTLMSEVARGADNPNFQTPKNLGTQQGPPK